MSGLWQLYVKQSQNPLLPPSGTHSRTSTLDEFRERELSVRPTQQVWLAALSRHDSDRLPVLRRNKGKTDSLKKGNERKQKFLAALSLSRNKMSIKDIH